LEKAGINYSDVRRRKRWTRENLVEGILELKKQGVKLITPEVKRANPSLFAAACKKHFFGTWKKALRAALRTEKENLQVETVASVTEVAPEAKAVETQLAGLSA
jgi:hypothetical protein